MPYLLTERNLRIMIMFRGTQNYAHNLWLLKYTNKESKSFCKLMYAALKYTGITK